MNQVYLPLPPHQISSSSPLFPQKWEVESSKNRPKPSVSPGPNDYLTHTQTSFPFLISTESPTPTTLTRVPVLGTWMYPSLPKPLLLLFGS